MVFSMMRTQLLLCSVVLLKVRYIIYCNSINFYKTCREFGFIELKLVEIELWVNIKMKKKGILKFMRNDVYIWFLN